MRFDWTKYDEKKAREIARSFANASIQDMAINIQRMGLVDKRQLLNSLRASVRADKFGEVNRIQFAYEFYGRFQEMGTKKGIKAKPWRNPAIEENKPELDEKFNELYATMILDELQIESVKIEM